MKRVIPIAILLGGMIVVPVHAAENASVSTLTTAEKASASTASEEVGLAASEALCGQSSIAGYRLEHGNVISGSEWVYIGAKRATKNTDYTIDYTSGTLYLMQPLSSDESVRIDYRYSEKDSAATRTGPSLAFSPSALGGNMKMSMLYATHSADSTLGAGAQDILTYGMNATTKFGSSTSLTSMIYMSSPQTSNRLAITSSTKSSSTTATKVKNDRMIVQSADMGLGKVKVQVGYQDIGEDFAGFNSMRDSKVTEDATLKQLEKEAGIKRMSMAAAVPTGDAAGLNFSFGRITDEDNNYIVSQAFGYNTGLYKFDFSTREVGADFDRFDDLRESDRLQFENEAGMRRAQYALKMGAGKSGISDNLNMTQISDGDSTLTQRYANLDMGAIKLSADVRTADTGFDGMDALSSDERARMSLMARKMFDPDTQASAVTSTDKANMADETGLDRAGYLMQVKSGEVNTWMSFMNVDSASGDLNRSAMRIKGRKFSLYFNRHSIDDTFSRLSDLQTTEISNFGDEYGMSRLGAGGTFTLGFGELALNAVNIKDNDGAGLMKRSIDLKNNRLKLHANYQNIDSNFDRIDDLSDIDQNDMIDGTGYEWSDYSINFQATSALNVDSYIYNAVNSTDGETHDQNRLSLKYAPNQNATYYTMDTNSINYGEGKFMDSRSVGIGHKVTRNLSLLTKLAHVRTHSDNSSMAGTLGFDWTVGSGVTISGNISNDAGNTDGYQRNRKLAINGLVIKRFLLFNDVTLGTGINTTNLKGSRSTSDNAFKLQTNVMGSGTFAIDNSDKYNQNTGLYNTSRIIKYESDKNKSKLINISLLEQYTVTSSTTTKDKSSYSANVKVSQNTSVTYKDQTTSTHSSSATKEVAETVFSANHAISDTLTLTGDYTRQINDSSEEWTHIMGMGISGTLKNKCKFELYFGISHLTDGSDNDYSDVFKVKYDHKLDANHYITLSAQKRSSLDAAVDDDEGVTVGTLQFRTVFD
ncbi:MAG: hypothetical protein ABFD49_08590 [Armatimonadota bacterium]|nr:hypothetical protein [bacterium]